MSPNIGADIGTITGILLIIAPVRSGGAAHTKQLSRIFSMYNDTEVFWANFLGKYAPLKNTAQNTMTLAA
jgi:hypothetical protein